MKQLTIFLALLLLTASLSTAADTPQRVNYQGVLRDSSDRPISGSVAMRFRFYDAPSAGNLLWEEDYGSMIPPAVTVTNGLFGVALGDPLHYSGGFIFNFADIFKDYTDVYLALVVGSDPEMTPRIKVIASAYSLNAQHLGGKSAPEFLDISSASQIKWGPLTLNASGAPSGYGVEAQGPTAGGYFRDSNDTGYAYVGYVNKGIEGYGSWMGGYFKDSDQSGYANVAYGDGGIEGWGNGWGGFFADLDNSGRGYVGYWDYGLYALGNYAAGYFQDWDSSGYAYVGSGDSGINAYGYTSGGYFADSNSSGYAYVGYGDTGISAYGSSSGGYFADSDDTGRAYVGYGSTGIDAYGAAEGGHFENGYLDTLAYVASGDQGIWASGAHAGAEFRDADGSGYAHIGYEDQGLYAWGDTLGGELQDLNSTSYAYVGYSTYKIYGSGAVSFVQNHPYDKDRVIVYAAPEGDEVATYTRGAARLINGETRIPLGDTFKWVTNPDIGLTAYLTPRGDCKGLYVHSLTTSELVVREMDGGTGDVAFDYIVYGLRIGFEESSVVQEKKQESYIPSMKDHHDLYAAHPELRSFNSLERFKKMGGGESVDLSASVALETAIHEYDPATDPPACELSRTRHCSEKTVQRRGGPEAGPARAVPAVPKPIDMPRGGLPDARTQAQRTPASSEPEGASPGIVAPSPNLFAVSEPVEIGDLLTLDPVNPGRLQKARVAVDRYVVGIVAFAAPTKQNGEIEAALAEANFAVVKADASYGAIAAGDLLVTSTTEGHAMRAPEVRSDGTVIGKALEPLEFGAGLIKVLVMSR